MVYNTTSKRTPSIRTRSEEGERQCLAGAVAAGRVHAAPARIGDSPCAAMPQQQQQRKVFAAMQAANALADVNSPQRGEAAQASACLRGGGGAG